MTYDGGAGGSGRSSGVATGWIIVSLVVALIGAIGVIIGGYVSRDTNTPTPTSQPSQPIAVSEAPVSPAPVTQAPPPQPTQEPPKPLPYKIDPPEEATVKMCTAFTGTGSAPEGRYLWIVVKSPPPDNKFYFQDTRTDYPSPGHWRAERVVVGEDHPDELGQKYRIIIVTLTPAVHAKANNGDYSDGVYPLPDGAHEEESIGVTAGERTGC